MDNSLRSKVFAINWDAWSNKRVPIVVAPIFGGLGGMIGSILSRYFASSELGQILVIMLFTGVAWIAGLTHLALND